MASDSGQYRAVPRRRIRRRLECRQPSRVTDGRSSKPRPCEPLRSRRNTLIAPNTVNVDRTFAWFSDY